MSVRSGTCAFCGAAGATVRTSVLDQRATSPLGGSTVVALDHGWYRTPGRTVAAPVIGASKFFSPEVHALCDYCSNGWVDDVQARVQPALLALGHHRTVQVRIGADRLALTRWARLTAVLADLLDGIPTVSSPLQRDAVRKGADPTPTLSTWFFSTRQRLPCRVHLSQVRADTNSDHTGVVQVVSVELGHLTTLVVLPSDDLALELVQRSALSAEFGSPATGEEDRLGQLDLARNPHPHRVAVHRLCAASPAGVC